MHGSSRTAKEALDIGSEYSKKNNFILLVPEFSEKNYPGDTYAFGCMIDSTGKVLEKSSWAFTSIEKIFDKIKNELQLTTNTYDILGHSAGGQFVHRMVLFAPQSRFRRAVASSPGKYAFPSLSIQFPYGYKGILFDTSVIINAFSRDFILILGDHDTDDKLREKEAMNQGKNRFARGLRFFAAGTEEANMIKAPFLWRLRIVYGADHSPYHMVKAGFEELFR
jgi:pimeloyl-ACP methyl ester carboxylesterase